MLNMPAGMNRSSTSPQDVKICQVTSVNANKCCKSREPLTKLHINATSNIGGNSNQRNQEKRSVSGEHCDHICSTRQPEIDTVGGKHAPEVTQRSRQNTSGKKADIAKQSMGYDSTVLSLDSGSLPVNSGTLPVNSGSLPVNSWSLPKNYETLPVNSGKLLVDSGSLSVNSGSLRVNSESIPVDSGSLPVDSESLPVDLGNLPVDSGSLSVVKDETRVSSNLGCNVNEQKSEDAKVDDCLCNSSHRKSQTSFLARVDEPVKSSSENESALSQAEADPGNECVTNRNESAYPSVEGTTAISNRNACPNTNVNECKELESTCEDKDTHVNITQCPSHSTRYSVEQERSLRAYSQTTPRTTTIELNAHSVNSSGKKYSDFSISFLLNQDSPSMSGTIRCNHRKAEQTTRRRHESPCRGAKRLALSTAFCCNTSTTQSCANFLAGCSRGNTTISRSCGDTMTRCCCDQCSSNPIGTACRCEDDCRSRLTPDTDTGCSGKSKNRCVSATHIKNKQFALRPHYDRLSTPTTMSSSPQNEQKLNSSLTDFSGESYATDFKVEATEGDRRDDYEKTRPNTVQRQLKRTWTDDDVNNFQTPVSHERSLDSPPLVAAGKMSRFKYTEEQVLYLKAEFDRSRYPSYDDLVQMSEDTQVPVRQLQVWFQNKRASTTGTRRPKIKRTDDSLDYTSLSKPCIDDLAAHPTQPRPVVPSSCTDSSGQSLQYGQSVQHGQPLQNALLMQDCVHQPYTPWMLTDFLARQQDLAMNAFTHGPPAMAATQHRHWLPAHFLPHVHPGNSFDAAALQDYLAAIYSRRPGVALAHPDTSFLQLINSNMSGPPTLETMPGPLAAYYRQLFSLLASPGVHATSSVSSSRDSQPADVATSSKLPTIFPSRRDKPA